MDPVQLSLLVEVDYNRKYSVKARMDLEMWSLVYAMEEADLGGLRILFCQHTAAIIRQIPVPCTACTTELSPPPDSTPSSSSIFSLPVWSIMGGSVEFDLWPVWGMFNWSGSLAQGLKEARPTSRAWSLLIDRVCVLLFWVERRTTEISLYVYAGTSPISLNFRLNQYSLTTTTVVLISITWQVVEKMKIQT